MPSSLPPGEAAPPDGSLPGPALAELGNRPFGVYVHVPFCARRCGYCDFNTYTAPELGGRQGAAQAAYLDAVAAELRLAQRSLGGGAPAVSSVFFGGGTPTLLPPEALGGLLAAIRATFDLTPDAEVTTEANPDSVDRDSLRRLRDGGFTRISYGMQSAVPHVLAALDRTHDPDRLPEVVADARAAGLAVSLDLIYGAPGESFGDWETSLKAAIALQPDHVSAYALTIEPGTALSRRVARGEVPAPDDDMLAEDYELADDLLERAGMRWYEISNWAVDRTAECRHNRLYWSSGNWWGLGPGAHSHVGGTRWWNVKHPSAYSGHLVAGRSPAYAREVLDAETRRVERVLLELRLREGLDARVLSPSGLAALPGLVADGLVEDGPGRVRLTRSGRLLADTVTRAVLP